ncbi:MAG TPA: helix-hairpin-helix domain-containing protein [Noviherbaspirillum sp.]|nr:helix-hairpin-helix domain-containing protein [Noviherbaspirillum sp.]
MLKRLLLATATLCLTMGIASAGVDVNKADQAALDGVRGIGPKTSGAILEERKKGGEFKDWTDLESRVKGVGEKSAVKLSEAGLTVNGQPRPNSAATTVSKDEKKVKSVAKKDDAKK